MMTPEERARQCLFIETPQAHLTTGMKSQVKIVAAAIREAQREQMAEIERLANELRIAQDTRNRAQATSVRDLEAKREAEAECQRLRSALSRLADFNEQLLWMGAVETPNTVKNEIDIAREALGEPKHHG